MTDVAPETFEDGDAKATLYRDAPSWQGRRTAAIGRFSCAHPGAGTALLRRLCANARSDGYEAVIGPMDGDTWHAYRVVAETDGSPPFFLEPVSGAHDLAAFTAAGFSPISSYVSARTELDAAIAAEPVAVDGITVRPWDGRDAMTLIGGLFDMSRTAFAGNAFYKPISKDAFLALYQPILPAINPRLVFFAHDEQGALAGYLFAIPDRLQGAAPRTGIIKTYASARRGVGHLLADQAHRTMRDLGMVDVIHALMHVDNRSRDRSARHQGRIFRRYDLLACDLRAGQP